MIAKIDIRMFVVSIFTEFRINFMKIGEIARTRLAEIEYLTPLRLFSLTIQCPSYQFNRFYFF